MIQQKKIPLFDKYELPIFFSLFVFTIVDKHLYHKALAVSFDILKLYYAHDLLCKYLTIKLTLAILKNFNSLAFSPLSFKCNEIHKDYIQEYHMNAIDHP